MAPTRSERIIERVERRFDSGENHFRARTVLADFALRGAQDAKELIEDSNERIIRSLSSAGAEAVIYTITGDNGHGGHASAAYVCVTKRDGVETLARMKPLLPGSGEAYVPILTTNQIDY